ncbi:MAG: hypothetical protein HZA89_15315 [Verrucomicrobia bacterium]|nr:hypothetical protein [Verrucomicrobiota bacterium]
MNSRLPMTRRLKSLPWLALLLVSLSFAFRGVAQSNIVFNPSFEIDFPHIFEGWSAAYLGGAVNEPGAAEGGAWVGIGNGSGGVRATYPNYLLFQDLKTVPGRVYDLRFATRGNLQGLKVLFGDTVAGTIDIGGSTGFWFYTNYTVTATSTNTRLAFDNSGGSNYADVDAVSVRWVAEPAGIIKPVVSRSAYEGATVGFAVKGQGVPPLSYQWHRDGQPMAGQMGNALTLTNITLADNGRYYVVVSNAFGAAQSLDAILAVTPLPQTPLITTQPKSLSVFSGYEPTLDVSVVGQGSLTYQWQFNGSNIAGATNNKLLMPSASETNSGLYTVVISNPNGVTVSLPASLNINPSPSGTFIDIRNEGTPVFDVDGVTRLAGTNYLARLYGGVNSNSLHAFGSTSVFYTDGYGLQAGVFESLAGLVPDTATVGQNLYVQVRVWERASGEDYEEARLRGGKIGKSDLFRIQARSYPPFPSFRNLTNSFSLEAGSPLYASAKLDPGQVTPEGGVELLVTGEVGTRYLIEYSPLSPPSWMPLMVVTNQTGTVSFVDANAATNSARIYRAQILSD